MVHEGIVIFHKISQHGIEVDRAKIDTIEKLPPPSSVKEIRSFLGQARFNWHFIKDFTKITWLLTQLLEKDVPFEFSKECFTTTKLIINNKFNFYILAFSYKKNT